MIGPNFVWRCVFQNLSHSDGQNKDCCQLITGFLIGDLCENVLGCVFVGNTYRPYVCVLLMDAQGFFCNSCLPDS